MLGLTTSSGGWVPRSDQKSDSGLPSVPGQCFPGLDLGPGQKMSLDLLLELDLVEALPLVPPKGIFVGSEDGLELATRGVVPLSSVVGVEPSSCLGVLVPSVSEPSSSICVCRSSVEGFDVEVKASGDSPTTEATPATAASIGYVAGDGFGDGNGSVNVAMMPIPGFPFPYAEDFPTGFLNRHWEDQFSSRPADNLGVPLKEVFVVP